MFKFQILYSKCRFWINFQSFQCKLRLNFKFKFQHSLFPAISSSELFLPHVIYFSPLAVQEKFPSSHCNSPLVRSDCEHRHHVCVYMRADLICIVPLCTHSGTAWNFSSACWKRIFIFTPWMRSCRRKALLLKWKFLRQIVPSLGVYKSYIECAPPTYLAYSISTKLLQGTRCGQWERERKKMRRVACKLFDNFYNIRSTRKNVSRVNALAKQISLLCVLRKA